jgi:hypothetical protein
MPPLTQAQLKAHLHYDPETGVFTRIAKICGRAKIGDVAGGLDEKGYVRIKVYGHKYRAHRLAWLYMMGKWPTCEIDHENCIKNDNRWDNLREANTFGNKQNQKKAQRNNRVGLLGVSPNGKKFRATIYLTKNGKKKQYYLGDHQTPELAHTAYLKAKRQLHEGCTI